MIQDIFPSVFYNQYEKKEPKDDSVLMFIKGNDVLFKKDGETVVYPLYGEYDTTDVELRYLFSIDDKSYFLVFKDLYGAKGAKACPGYARLLRELGDKGFEFKNRMELRRSSDRMNAFAGAVAFQIGRWYADNRICGRCGHKLVHSEDERMMRCDACGNMIYPKICPAVIVAVIDGDKILVTKYSVGFSHYALIAGFAESGETIEETVHREVMEEVGLRVKNLRYYKSQPWGFSSTLLFGFFAHVKGSTKITLQEEELSVARWVKEEDIIDTSGNAPLTSEMIQYFKKGKIQ